MIKASIIVPVYNVAPFLRRCLDSLVNQTLQHIQIICINDGSSDESLAILRDYSEQDNRIVIIDFHRNQGVSAARNAGIAIACGEYLGFVDGDDEVDTYFYESLYTKATTAKACIVKGALHWVDNGNTVFTFSHRPSVNEDKTQVSDFFFTGLYQTAFIHGFGILFPLGITNGEDWAFLGKAVSIAPSIEVLDGAVYYHHRRTGSADPQVWTQDTLNIVFKSLQDLFSYMRLHLIDTATYTNICSCYILKYLETKKNIARDDKRSFFQCAKNAIQLYQSCNNKDVLKNRLYESLDTIAVGFLVSEEVDKLTNYLYKDVSQQQKVFAALRRRITEKL